MPAALIIARRELAAYFHAPIAYVVGVVFLVIQGLSFWAVVEVLANPGQPAPYGAVLRGHFGGSVLYWMVLFLVVAVLAMRLVAEEKRAGTWELLLTTRVEDSSVLLGKWLGAVGFYVVLWLPTLLYLAVLARYAPEAPDGAGGVDLGPIAAAYLGVVISGAAFLALGLAASTATSNQIVAAVVTFTLLLVVLMLGQVPDIAPGWTEASPRFAALIRAVDVRDHMDRFASGAIDTGPIVFYASLCAAGLSAATALASLGRRTAREIQGRLLAAALIAVILVLANIVAARNPSRWDVSAARVNTLEPATLSALARLESPVRLLVIRPGEADFAPVWNEVDAVLDRMMAVQPLLTRQDVDPVLQADRMANLATELGIVPKDLKDYGAVVVQVSTASGARTRVIDLIDVAEFDRDALGRGRMGAFRGERAIATAIVDASSRDRPVVCATSGHGELPVRAADGASDWRALAERLDREGFGVEDIGVVSAGVPAYCRVLVVIGPTYPLSPDEALAVDHYLGAGGRLLLAVGAPPDGEQVLSPTGLELVVDGFGIGIPRAVAIDRSEATAVGDLVDGFRVVDTYGEHPITASFRGRRVTVWQRPRALLVDDVATSLVSTSARGWGETEVPVPMTTEADVDDLPGPISIAAAAQRDDARVVVFGSEHGLYSDLAAHGLGGNQTLALASIAWLTGRTGFVEVGDKTPEQLSLVMTSGQRATTFVMCVVVIPLAFALVGALLWRRRRRG